ncbi:helix-turn-helix domain-containing protein [Carboxylicivirga sp. RSCT41]|uniref:helix-turn-helix domain-containing protein n=1 Tax=Carboxylicivirga agarovorans TaxID=3417570 RepID=UPI003D34758B
MQYLKRNFVAILSIYIIIAVTFAAIHIVRVNNYEKEIVHVYDKESKLLKWKLQVIEESCLQVLTTVNELLAVKPIDSEQERIDFETRIFSSFIKGYEVIEEFKGLSSDSIALRVVRLSDTDYMRRVLIRDRNEFYTERFNLDKQGFPVNIERLKNSHIQEEDTSWFTNELYYTNKIVLSDFYRSHMLDRQLVEAANLSDDNSGRLLAVDVSLEYIARSFKKIKQLDSYFILTDRSDNVVLLAYGKGENIRIGSDIELNVTQSEVREFLNTTLERKYFPSEFYSFDFDKETYMVKWEGFKIGNQTYRLGYMIKHQKSMWKLGLFIVFNLLLVVFLLVKIRYAKHIVGDDAMAEAASTRSVPVQSDAEEDYKVIYQALSELFKSRKEYLDVNCSLGQLSNALACNRAALSKAVLAEENKTIKELINDYRIADAVEFMKNDQEALLLSIDSIAEKFGYKSRASFHREFNKRMNFSPVEYINLNNINKK